MDTARTVCREMITHRGYEIINDDSDEIIAQNDKEQMLVLFVPEEKVTINTIKECLEKMKEYDLKHVILVYEDKFTSHAKNTVIQMGSIKDPDNPSDIEFEIFSKDELQINKTKHTLVPKHELATPKEIKELLQTVTKDKLPVIYKNDPMCKFHNFQVDDILRITRRNGFISYRLVTNTMI